MNIEELFNTVCDYCYDIIDGKIKACNKHILACRRFLNDLEKQEDENYKYYFDIDELYKFNEWAKLFKHRTGIVGGQQIILVPWQLFIVGNLFGWKNKKTGFRRFRKAFISVGRKNAKSELLSLICTYECFITNDNSEIYLSGWTKDGSEIVYREIQYHLAHPYIEDFFEGKYKDSYGRITHIKSGSFIRPLSREAKNTDNANNPSLAVIDEYKDHITSEVYDNLESGMMRPNALIVIISTAGPNLNSPMMTEYMYVSKILDPELEDIQNDEYFIMICEVENINEVHDKSNWIKANPIVATNEFTFGTVLEDKYKAAKDVPEKMRTFLTKNMNIWVDMKDNGFMNMEKWSKCAANISFEDFRNMECIVGADLSKKIDLTSVTFEFFKDGLYYFIQHSWIPEERYNYVLSEGKYRYDLWVDAGYLSVCSGATINYDEIIDFMENIRKTYNIKIKEFCYDPYNASQFVNTLFTDYGYKCIEVRQCPRILNEPTKDIRNLTYENKLRHPINDGLMNFAMSNCIASQHKQEWIMLDKEKSSDKIDPIAATVDAHSRGISVLKNHTKSIFYVPNRRR